jgi:hypothetical protein
MRGCEVNGLRDWEILEIKEELTDRKLGYPEYQLIPWTLFLYLFHSIFSFRFCV